MKKALCIILLAAFVLLGGCSGEKEISFTAMDTVMTLRAEGKNAEKALEEAKKTLNELENELSRTIEESDVSRLNAAEGEWTEVSDDAFGVISYAVSARERTGGAFDVTVAPVMDLWNFSGGGNVPTEKELSAALEKVGAEIELQDGRVRLSTGGSIDLGGIAKGYSGDAFRKVMEENGIKSALGYLGGNVVLVGSKSDGSDWRVAVQDPQDGGKTVGVISASDVSVVTSGGYERFFERDGVTYHHIIDPKTGRSSDSGLLSVTVVMEDGTMADALSTALFVMGEEKAVEHWRSYGDFAMLLVTDDGRVIATENLNFEFDGDGYVFETCEK